MDIAHYIQKCKEHEDQRLSWTERHEYWKQYNQVHRHSVNEMDTSQYQSRDALDS